ncbi:hypothetical protein QE152_g19144 [Popillia japonica]|uniref:C2H2-type domain-containing protein n=1 Tax=Popillia japonica TaxID=7064 RepID=A0AAW1KXX7_POPJA
MAELEQHSSSLSTPIICSYCSQVFTRTANMKRHINRIHKCYLCEKCGGTLETCVHVDRETKRQRLDAAASIECCSLSFINQRQYKNHLRSQTHAANTAQIFEQGVYKMQTSFKNRIASYRIVDSGTTDISTFLESIKTKVCKLIYNSILQLKSLKVQFELFAFYAKFKNDEEHIELKSFNTKYVVVGESTILEDIFDKLADIIKTKSDEFQEKDSGFAFTKMSQP